ncbi:hypothetical protein FYK55_19120 [Roseiconus nitratireducens]|uniref:Cytochrome oxidase complex assembly protein 1 n=1 Tax=Roseiconus nitratireducens TaxID=2605748 RepID=A0A5M6D404_9BACT|nr:cytochrome c oxidase assembly factor Coa1 family protein [Roseiconus nitratireducens]KAA5541012.1 hypothetical protein FYK55_19120 [Roseiconus nitratireducens]
MSQAPNNPFDEPQRYGEQPKKSSNTWLWVLGILGGLFLLSSVICCGVVYYMSSEFSGFIANAAVGEFQDDPVIQEHIGQITSSDTNFGDAIQQSSDNQGVTTMVFDVTGEKGSGKIVLRTDQKTNKTSAVLQLDDGTEYDLEVPEQFGGVSAELEELEEMESQPQPTGESEPAEADSVPELNLEPLESEPAGAGQ